MAIHMPRSRGVRGLVLLITMLAGSSAVNAGELVDLLKARQAKIDALLANHPGDLPPAVRQEVGKAISELLDFPAMGRAAIAGEWDKRDEAQRSAYLAAFEGLVRANILRRVDIYRTEAIEYQDELIKADEGSVKSIVKSKSATTEVVYSLHRGEGRWRIIDYTIDGVSAVKNYRSQFAKLLEKKGWDPMVERLRKRRDEIEMESASGTADTNAAATK